MTTNPFDQRADQYDAWFDSDEGRELFPLEVECLKKAMAGNKNRHWLETGVGTGRFAQELNIQHGVDPSEPMLLHAAKRGITVKPGTAEKLPYPDASFDGILMVVTICFVDDPRQAFKESRRVLRSNGRLLAGLVPADSSWGKFYMEKKKLGHPFYSAARFYTSDRIIEMGTAAGFEFSGAHTCLFTEPEQPVTDKSIRSGLVPGAGFVALGFEVPG